MRFWLDTEFIDNGRTLELISIGIVAEDGREYYAISSDFDEASASEWVRQHVLKHLPPRNDPAWRPRIRIRDEVLAFVGQKSPEIWAYNGSYDWVILLQLFGPMAQGPRGWPTHIMDLKQWRIFLGWPKLPKQAGGQHHALEDARWNRLAWEHLHALTAARTPVSNNLPTVDPCSSLQVSQDDCNGTATPSL